MFTPLTATKSVGHVVPDPVVDVLYVGFRTETKTTAPALVAYNTYLVRTAGPWPKGGRYTTTGSARGGRPSAPTYRIASTVPGGMTRAVGAGDVGVAVGARVGDGVGDIVVGAGDGADVDVGASVVGDDVGDEDAIVGLDVGSRRRISVDCPVPCVKSDKLPSVIYTHIKYAPAGVDGATSTVKSYEIPTPAAMSTRLPTPPDTLALTIENAELRNTTTNVTGTGAEYMTETEISVRCGATARKTCDETAAHARLLATLGAAVGEKVVVAGIDVGTAVVGADVGGNDVGTADVGVAVVGNDVGDAEVGDSDVGITGVGLAVVGLAVEGAAVVGLPVDGAPDVGTAVVGLAVTGLSVVGADDGVPVVGAAVTTVKEALIAAGAPKRLANLKVWDVGRCFQCESLV